jgi:hypothetical protein
MKVELQYFEGCPHWQTADDRLRQVAADRNLTVEHHLITTPAEAEEAQFRGSPTILIDGVDPFARGDDPVGLSCRLYQTPDGPAGSPTVTQLEAVLQR